MKGLILDYSIQENKGAINTDNGERYYFTGADWRESQLPKKGDVIDFEVDIENEKNAKMVYLALNDNRQVNRINLGYVGKPSNPVDYEAQERFSVVEWFTKTLRDFGYFNGRSRRKEYWIFTLVLIGMFIITLIIDNAIFGTLALTYILGIVTLVPSLALIVRRLHDINQSGWFAIISFIPMVNWVFIIIIGCIETQQENNQWGLPSKKSL
nr:DUF805 domain-containing protein [Providencia stuartii]ELR5082320.1 DUF805 domain-containing protein [Providencia stuartii]